MISKKTYIPAKPRNRKLIGGILPTGEGIVSDGLQHSHANKQVIDRLTQLNIDVLSYFSLHQTGIQMTQQLDELGNPVFDEFGNPVMIPVLVNVYDELGNQLLDELGQPVTETVPIYAVKSTASFISEKEITAYGPGESEGTGGGFDMLLAWVDYAAGKEQWIVSAELSKGLLDRIVALEAGGGGGGSTVAWGALTNGYRQLTVDTVTYSLATDAHTHTGYAASSHSHAISDITGLQTALDGKAASSHTHTIANVTGLQTALDGKAASSHTHTIANVTGLQTALDGKANASHTHTVADITDLASNYVTLSTTQTISGAKTFSAALTASVKVTTPVLDLGNGWTIEAGTSKIEVKQGTTIRARFESYGFVSTGEITATN